MTERSIKEIAQDLKTQSNRITHLPIFVIEKKVRDFGYDVDYGEAQVWLDSEYNEVEAPVADEDIEDDDDWDAEERAKEKGWRKTGYRDRWEFVTACLTENGCERHLELNGHNLGETRIYVHSGYRVPEIETLREHLMGLADKEDEVEKLKALIKKYAEWVKENEGITYLSNIYDHEFLQMDEPGTKEEWDALREAAGIDD